MKVYEYEGIIQGAKGGGAYVEFPYDIRKEFQKGRVKVYATFDGITYEGSIVNMGLYKEDGSICYVIGILKSIRQQLGKQIGDRLQVRIWEKI